jgi:(S)-3,5-dihydroxyphenylglycine transaminase
VVSRDFAVRSRTGSTRPGPHRYAADQKESDLMVQLAREALHESVTDPVAASMNFLNEIAGRYPASISLAAGRPFDEFYAVADVERYLAVYVAHLRGLGMSEAAIRQAILQYGRTNGQIAAMIARMLAADESISVPAESIMVTAGCQEAMIIALRGLCAGPDDVVLAAEPCYVGFTGAARVLGVPVVPVPETAQGLSPETVARVAREVRASGRRPRALYVVSNFANPSGVSLSAEVRRGLLKTAADEDLLILEDDPYGLFGADDGRLPALKSLDADQRVIYLGSFAKSLFPGARVGFLVADSRFTSATCASCWPLSAAVSPARTLPGTRPRAASSPCSTCPFGPTRNCSSCPRATTACCGRR